MMTKTSFFYCAKCGKKVFDRPSHIKLRKYCSQKCMSQAYKILLQDQNNPNWKGGNIEKSCEMCGKKYFVFPVNSNASKYCSQRCLWKAHSILRSGKNNVHWIDGRANNTRRLRTPEWRNIRKKILERDKHCCRICGTQNNQLDVHHIIKYKNGGTDMPANLISVCKKCHAEVDAEIKPSTSKTGEIV